MSTCTCFPVGPQYWTTHYGAVDPATTLEPNPECPEHFPQTRIEWTGNIQVHHPIPDPPDRTGMEWADKHDERL